MLQKQEAVRPLETSIEHITLRTPGRKLTKEDLSATSALILGCTTQCCSSDCSGGGPKVPKLPE